MQKILCLALIILAAGCHEKSNCPAFSDDYLKWMPYEDGQICYFTDGNDTIRLVVTETYKSSEYVLRQPFLTGKMPCDAEARVKMSGDQSTPEIEIESDYFSETSPVEGNISYSFLYDEYSTFFLGFAGKSVVNDPWNQIALISEYNNGHHVFSNVIKTTLDTTRVDDQIYQLYLAESVGIIQFRDWKNRKTWSLVDR